MYHKFKLPKKICNKYHKTLKRILPHCTNMLSKRIFFEEVRDKNFLFNHEKFIAMLTTKSPLLLHNH